eukprot:2273093-Rhodomonas_salina.3
MSGTEIGYAGTSSSWSLYGAGVIFASGRGSASVYGDSSPILGDIALVSSSPEFHPFLQALPPYMVANRLYCKRHGSKSSISGAELAMPLRT